MFLFLSSMLMLIMGQERMLQVSSATCSTLQKEVEVAKRRFRELEEQVQGDDRVERLENTLKNTQDRGADLELQLSKAKQVSLDIWGVRVVIDVWGV